MSFELVLSHLFLQLYSVDFLNLLLEIELGFLVMKLILKAFMAKLLVFDLVLNLHVKFGQEDLLFVV